MATVTTKYNKKLGLFYNEYFEEGYNIGAIPITNLEDNYNTRYFESPDVAERIAAFYVNEGDTYVPVSKKIYTHWVCKHVLPKIDTRKLIAYIIYAANKENDDAAKVALDIIKEKDYATDLHNRTDNGS